MLLSLNWLKNYIDLPKNLTAKQLAHDLTMATVEVESITVQAKQFENMVVGKIMAIKKHPNADKLKVVMADIGKEIKKLRNLEIKGKKLIQIICGGINLREGILVAVALPDAKVRWHGKGELAKLEKAKIRGVASEGMICSSNEIGLQNILPCGGMEVTDLSSIKGAKVGMPLAEALGFDDVIIEIENKSLTNRPDLWNHYGMARELAAIYNTKLKLLEMVDKSQITSTKYQINSKFQIPNVKLNIKIKDRKLCSRYIGCVVSNVKVEKSPDWLVKRLEAVGMRAINNIVDITNYVMLDVGEPMHAFDVASLHADQDADLRRGITRKIIIRRTRDGEKIKTFDNETKNLDESMLVIADNEKLIALAGIMGGADSGVAENTKDIVLEAATFNALSVRRTAQKLNLRTEASMRFEKNLDPNLAELGMRHALKLIKEIMPGAKISPMVDVDYSKKEKIKIKVEHEFLEKRIGCELKPELVVGILERLGFKIKMETAGDIGSTVSPRGQGVNPDPSRVVFKITVPSWRATGDVKIPEDIVEEVARIYGYDNLKKKVEFIEMKKVVYQREFELENKIKNYLSVGCGMNEVFNYPWLEGRVLEDLEICGGEMIEIANPPAEENRYLQTTLIPNLIRNIKDNLRYFDEFKIFELARVFQNKPGKKYGDDKLPCQPKMLAGAVVVEKDKDAFLEVKGIIEKFSIFNFQFSIKDLKLDFINSEKCLAVEIDGQPIGWLGELRKEIYQEFNFKKRNVCLFEINFDELIKIVGTGRDLSAKKYQPLPQYPSVVRDLAIEMEWRVKWGELKKVILSELKDPLISEVNFLSEYDLGPKKSLAFRVTYQADRTLKDEEVVTVEKEIIKMLGEKFGGQLRK